MNGLKIAAAILGCLAWILQCTAVGGTSWWVAAGGLVHGGLFTYCYKIFISICAALPSQYVSSKISACGGLLAFGIVLTSIALILCFVNCCCARSKVPVAIASGVLFALSAFLTFIAIILAAVEYTGWTHVGVSLGWSFYVAVICMILLIVVAIFIILGGKKEANFVAGGGGAIIIQQPQVIMMQQQPQQQQQYQQQPQQQQQYQQQQQQQEFEKPPSYDNHPNQVS